MMNFNFNRPDFIKNMSLEIGSAAICHLSQPTTRLDASPRYCIPTP